MDYSKELLQALHADINKAVKEACEKHGVQLAKYSGKYGDALKMTFEFSKTELGANGVNLASHEAQDHGWASKSYDLDDTVFLGMLVQASGSIYRYDGIATKRPKFPFEITNMKTGAKAKAPSTWATLLNSSTENTIQIRLQAMLSNMANA